MKYLASLPEMAGYLQQYFRYQYGELDDGAINLKGIHSAAGILRRNLVPFRSEELAEERWPKQHTNEKRVGLLELRNKTPQGYSHQTFWMLGPNGARELMDVLLAQFDLCLVREWTEYCAAFAETCSTPVMKVFIDSFMERHGIDIQEQEYYAVSKRLQRIMKRATEFPANNQEFDE